MVTGPSRYRRRGDRTGLARDAELTHRLLALKSLGFSLTQVGQMLASDLERQVRQDRYRLARAEARLTLLGEDSPMTHPITTKTVAPVHLAALCQDHAGSDRTGAGPLIEPLFTRASDLADAASLSRLAPIGWYAAADGGVRLHTGFAVGAGEPAATGLDVVVVPGAQVAALLHVGEMSVIAQTYAELQQWAAEQGLSGPFTWREVYLEADVQDQSDWIVEVQLELSQAT